jgi:benzoyl-CoA reductase/2-hydroxyglutaryl-CoA dehydratase subunit BcrC/BadD/HgdB
MPSPEPPRLVLPTRSEIVREQLRAGGGIAAVFPIHYSRALLRAFDLLPVEVWGPPARDTSLGDAHLQAYTCSIVRAGLSFLLSGGLDAAAVVVVPHGCDSLQGLGSLLTDFHPPRKPVLPLYLPRGEGPSACDFLVEELGVMRRELVRWSGREPTDQELGVAIEREEQADGSLGRLHAERAWLDLSDQDFYRLVRSREYLPAERFTALAATALARKRETRRPGVPVLLSGVLPEPMSLLDVVAEAGGMVVADDLICTGRRIYPAGSSRLPLRRMAESLLGGPPDSTRGSPVASRVAHLRALVARSGARVAAFLIVKFCEPEQFYLPALRRALQDEGVRSVTIELDVAEPLSAQLATRLEALLEMVR